MIIALQNSDVRIQIGEPRERDLPSNLQFNLKSEFCNLQCKEPVC